MVSAPVARFFLTYCCVPVRHLQGDHGLLPTYHGHGEEGGDLTDTAWRLETKRKRCLVSFVLTDGLLDHYKWRRFLSPEATLCALCCLTMVRKPHCNTGSVESCCYVPNVVSVLILGVGVVICTCCFT
eukprot:6139317-Amphidinium_carterae.1